MKINLLLACAFLSIIIYANIDEMHGIVGLTKRDGGVGCVCHDLNPTDSVIVWIEGPDSVLRNSTVQYKLLMTGGPAVAGGLNIAAYFGELDSVDTLTQVLLGELTHTFPNPFQDDTVSWNFFYTAPDSLLIDTLYSVANSVNGNGNPSGDQWNFGENFIVDIIDYPTNTGDNYELPTQFVLEQNYPNPFNPITRINFTILGVTLSEVEGSLVTLKVYDILGNEIVTLVNEEKLPGEYEVVFNAAGLASGIYFYALGTKSYFAVKKMILLR